MSLFKRPAWAKPRLSDGEKGGEEERNIFSHSHSYQDIVAEEQRAKREKAARAQAREKRKSQESAGGGEDFEVKGEGEGSASKRRRVTLEEGEGLLGGIGEGSATRRRESGGSEDEDEDERVVPIRQSQRNNRMISTNDRSGPSSSRVAATTILDDSDGGDEIQFVSSKPNDASKSDDESEDEFAELAKQARERQLQRQTHTPDADPTTKPTEPKPDTPPPHDPPIKLFISSRIPNTDCLIVFRKLSQRLKEIRDAWCTRQKFTEDFANTVYLVHRMRRIYNVTTCKSLGLDVDLNGSITMKGVTDKDGLDQIHLEAVTDEIYEQMKAEKAREEQKRQGLLPDEDGTETHEQGNEEEQAPQPANEEQLIRILLRLKGRTEPFKLKVKATTLFSKIIAASKTGFKLTGDEILSLEFDGEELNPGDEVGSTEIDDMDCIDVHISQ